jgi:hypothetical protein
MLAPFICSRRRVHSRCFEDCTCTPTGTLTTQHISDVTHPTRIHRYKTAAQILLILSTLNLVLGAPIFIREIHEADDDVKVVAEDVAAFSKKQHEVGETSNGLTSSPPSSSTSDGSTSSCYPWPSDGLTSSQYSSSLDGSTSLYHSLSSDGLISSQDSSSSDWSASPHSLAPPDGLTYSPYSSPDGSASPHFSSSDGPASSQCSSTEGSTSTRFSTSNRFTSSHHSSLLDGSTSTRYSLGQIGTLAPSDNRGVDTVSARYPSQIKTPPDKEKFFNKDEEKPQVFCGRGYH